MRSWIGASVAVIALAGCGGADRRASSALPVVPWQHACGRFARHDSDLRSLAYTFRLDPYLPTRSTVAVSRVRTDVAALKPYLTHGERIGLARYLTGVDSVELGIEAYLGGDVRGARENLSDGVADLDASGLTALCRGG
jgi:hypothetical protein